MTLFWGVLVILGFVVVGSAAIIIAAHYEEKSYRDSDNEHDYWLDD